MSSAWSVLYDQATGYPYYWNPQTNEVKWDKPPELMVHSATSQTFGHLEPAAEKVSNKKTCTESIRTPGF